MKPCDPRRRAPRGFTLVETLIVMVTLGIAAVTIATLSGNLFKGQSANRDIVVGTQLMQECAEILLVTRRNAGYASVNSTNFGTNKCGPMTALGSYAVPSVTLTDPYSGGACPTGGTCKTASISQGGMTPIVLLLVDY